MRTERSIEGSRLVRPGGQKLLFAGLVLVGLGALIWLLASGMTMDVSEEASRVGELIGLIVALAGLVTALVGLLKGLRAKDNAIEDANF